MAVCIDRVISFKNDFIDLFNISFCIGLSYNTIQGLNNENNFGDLNPFRSLAPALLVNKLNFH